MSEFRSGPGFGSSQPGEGSIVFTNVRVLDATGDQPFMGEVVVQGNRIASVTRGQRVTPGGGATVIDGGGATLTRRLIDAHLHLSGHNAPGIDPILRECDSWMPSAGVQ